MRFQQAESQLPGQAGQAGAKALRQTEQEQQARQEKMGSFWNRQQPFYDEALGEQRGFYRGMAEVANAGLQPENVLAMFALPLLGESLLGKPAMEVLGKVMFAQGAVGAGQSAADTELLERDPEQWLGQLLANTALMGPDVFGRVKAGQARTSAKQADAAAWAKGRAAEALEGRQTAERLADVGRVKVKASEQPLPANAPQPNAEPPQVPAGQVAGKGRVPEVPNVAVSPEQPAATTQVVTPKQEAQPLKARPYHRFNTDTGAFEPVSGKRVKIPGREGLDLFLAKHPSGRWEVVEGRSGLSVSDPDVKTQQQAIETAKARMERYEQNKGPIESSDRGEDRQRGPFTSLPGRGCESP